MADTLYLSLWYPNLRLAGLGEKLAQVLNTFASHGGEHRIYAATTWPINWNEAPVFQRIYAREGARDGAGGGADEKGAQIEQAIEEGLELLHDDYAYEFQIGWSLWEAESAADLPPHEHGPVRGDPGLDTRWIRESRLVRVIGYGPLFDDGAYEQEGHIRIDFGSDAAFLGEDAELGPAAARHVEENIRQLVELAAAIEKNSGATARVLWSELGESLAQRLASRLGAAN